MQKKYVILTAIIVLAVGFSWYINEGGITGRTIYSQNDKITIGVTTSPISALLMVSQDKGYFEEEGINAQLVEFTAGKLALQAFLGNSLDLTSTGEVPVMFSIVNDNKFQVITQLVEKTEDNIRIVARKENAADSIQTYFKTKRKVATSFGGGPEFYMYNLMKKYNITNIELINQNPQDMPAALSSGSVDAIAVFDPYAYYAEKTMGENAMTFSDNGLYSELFVLVAHDQWLEENPDTSRGVIKALEKASQFIEDNPEEAKAVVMKYTKMDKETLDSMWGNYAFKPVLNKHLTDNLKTEVEWAEETGNVKPETKIPDFRKYIYAGPLREVKPDAVSI